MMLPPKGLKMPLVSYFVIIHAFVDIYILPKFWILTFFVGNLSIQYYKKIIMCRMNKCRTSKSISLVRFCRNRLVC